MNVKWDEKAILFLAIKCKLQIKLFDFVHTIRLVKRMIILNPAVTVHFISTACIRHCAATSAGTAPVVL